MDFTALQARATLLASLEGWTDVSPSPTWSTLVNQAWYKFSWDSELIIGSTTFSTTSGTVSYALGTYQWKRLLEVVYDTAGTPSPVVHSTEDYERWLRADWRSQTSGVPVRFTFNSPDTISLVPPPSASSKTVSVRGIVQGLAMVSGTDSPGQVSGAGTAIPDVFHEAVAIYACYLQGKVYAQGEARARLQSYLDDYQGYVNNALGHTEPKAGGN